MKKINLNNLISLKDFVLKHNPTREQIVSYANFLDKPLKLEYFISCDEDGNVLEDVTKYNTPYTIGQLERIKEYLQAKERCLFEGLRIHDKYGRKDLYIEDWVVYGGELYIDCDHKAPYKANLSVEDLLILEREILLTPTALKQIGL